jgi:hypothetical protein
LQSVKNRLVLAKDYCGRTSPGGGECKNYVGNPGSSSGGMPPSSGSERTQAVLFTIVVVLFAYLAVTII